MSGGINWGSIVSLKVSFGVAEEIGAGLVVVVVGGVAVAGTGRWVGVLDCAEEVHCPSGFSWSNPYSRHIEDIPVAFVVDYPSIGKYL